MTRRERNQGFRKRDFSTYPPDDEGGDRAPSGSPPSSLNVFSGLKMPCGLGRGERYGRRGRCDVPRICNAQNSIVGCLDITNIPEQNSVAKHGLASVYVCDIHTYVSVSSTRNVRIRGFYPSPVTINVESVIIRVDVQKIISNLRYEVMTSFTIKNILYSIIHQTTHL